MLIPVGEDQSLQRSTTLPWIPALLYEVVAAQPLDQGSSLGTKPLRFCHQLVPWGLALLLENAVIPRQLVARIGRRAAVEGRVETPNRDLAPEIVVGYMVLGSPGVQLATRRALLRAQVRREGILVGLPSGQQRQQPSVVLALNRIHHLSRQMDCRCVGQQPARACVSPTGRGRQLRGAPLYQRECT